jgi:hypothetical protein
VLQTLNQRPQGLPGMQPIQDKMATGIGMGPGPQVGFTRILCIGMSVDKRVKLFIYIHHGGNIGGVMI